MTRPVQLIAFYLLHSTLPFPPTAAFKYKLPSQEITAPEMYCFSGDASSQRSDRSLPCPNNAEEVHNYPAVVMDEGGYATVKIKNVIMRDDGRRRHDILLQNNDEEAIYGHGRRNKKIKNKDKPPTSEPIPTLAGRGIDNPSHHLQVYLVPLEHYASIVNTSQCCYELEIHNTTPTLPKECHAIQRHSTTSGDDNTTADAYTNHDYRVHAPRLGKIAAISAPMMVNTYDNPVDIVAKLRPMSRGRHMVVVSNCAAELTIDPITNRTVAKGIKAVMQDGLEITFVSKFGELPLSMMGIIPFYGILAGIYGFMALVWRYKTQLTAVRANAAPLATPMLGLQKAIKYLIYSQFLFCTIAFVYYLHLNTISVDVEVLYSGTAAALINWGPWSILVALAHFGTIFGCQCVVTLATDGTWLIQNNIRKGTKYALYVLGGMWIVYFFVYGILSIEWRRRVFIIGGFVWILFLMFNLRRSLKHLRSLMIGQSEDMIMAIGGAIVAKRSLYRRMFVIVGVYPLVFLGSMFLTSRSREDSWAWVGYVLGDIYLFVILSHASCIWMPRPMASQELVKYAPLDVGVADDSEAWETGSFEGENWNEDEEVEIELS